MRIDQMIQFELTSDFFDDDRNVALYEYHQNGLDGLEKLKREWIKQGKADKLLGFLDGLIAVRKTDPSRITL
jgi:hypothetical protein